jgi:hypothetical protein
MSRIVVSLVLLVLVAITCGGASPTLKHGEPLLEKVTKENIHQLYAVDIIREHNFNVRPETVMEYCIANGNVVVQAPDPQAGHPNLFHMTAKRYQIMRRDKIENPMLTVIVLKDSVSVTYRDQIPKGPEITPAKVLQFCNAWNENFRLATCYVDQAEYINLHTDITTLGSPNEQADHMVDSLNRVLLDKGLYDFQLNLQRFAKKFVNEIVLPVDSKSEL